MQAFLQLVRARTLTGSCLSSWNVNRYVQMCTQWHIQWHWQISAHPWVLPRVFLNDSKWVTIGVQSLMVFPWSSTATPVVVIAPQGTPPSKNSVCLSRPNTFSNKVSNSFSTDGFESLSSVTCQWMMAKMKAWVDMQWFSIYSTPGQPGASSPSLTLLACKLH